MKIERIRTLRLKHNLTQAEIAHAVHVSQRAYSHYEIGTRSIPLETLIALCDHYHVSIDYMVGRTDKSDL
ncbi:MAG: helix-turn-helix transcriptional regulator [Eubacteriales bacterium]|nr:helix-turn-helix transcriptional regulator [Eubacteriales bacterium]